MIMYIMISVAHQSGDIDLLLVYPANIHVFM